VLKILDMGGEVDVRRLVSVAGSRVAHMSESSAGFAGRAALITGASRGIGRAIAAELLARGAAVAITARKPDELGSTARELAEAVPGGADRVLAVAGNAGLADDRAEAVARTVEAFGRLDVLVNNTGINPVFGDLMAADLDAVRKIFDTNVVAALGFVQDAWRAWMSEHGGVVINMASVGGLRSTGAIGAYGASKAALIRLTEELAWQLGPKVRVNAVAPAVIKTRFATAIYSGREAELSTQYPMKRLGEPGDVAQLVAFLASDAASWITGETVRVDGGLLATGTLG
jgi:NAD(P)-dependent dehydrogenase (short-subunit alcohol dehydrogenase family)